MKSIPLRSSFFVACEIPLYHRGLLPLPFSMALMNLSSVWKPLFFSIFLIIDSTLEFNFGVSDIFDFISFPSKKVYDIKFLNSPSIVLAQLILKIQRKCVRIETIWMKPKNQSLLASRRRRRACSISAPPGRRLLIFFYPEKKK